MSHRIFLGKYIDSTGLKALPTLTLFDMGFFGTVSHGGAMRAPIITLLLLVR